MGWAVVSHVSINTKLDGGSEELEEYPPRTSRPDKADANPVRVRCDTSASVPSENNIRSQGYDCTMTGGNDSGGRGCGVRGIAGR